MCRRNGEREGWRRRHEENERDWIRATEWSPFVLPRIDGIFCNSKSDFSVNLEDHRNDDTMLAEWGGGSVGSGMQAGRLAGHSFLILTSSNIQPDRHADSAGNYRFIDSILMPDDTFRSLMSCKCWSTALPRGPPGSRTQLPGHTPTSTKMKDDCLVIVSKWCVVMKSCHQLSHIN